MNKQSLLVFICLSVAISSCKPSFDDPKYDGGTADFTSYVALGNSLTAGYSDNALTVDGQVNSYPAMLAKQFGLVDGNGIFKIPLVDNLNAVKGVTPAPIAGALFRTTPKLVLVVSPDCKGVASLTPQFFDSATTNNTGFLASIKSEGPFNNLGVPGIKSFHLDNPEVANLSPTNQLFNPFYYRFASAPQSSTILGDALLSDPTFFSLWLGNNDVLWYAINGGENAVQPGMSQFDITPVDTFKNALQNAVVKLTATGAKGVIANIPDVTDIPFFITIPYNGLVLTTQAEVDILNAAYPGLTVPFVLGANGFIVSETAGTFRRIIPGELICLSTPRDSIKCAGWGSMVPIADEYWLDATELSLIKIATTTFNSHIATLAGQHGLALVDFNAYFKSVKSHGTIYNGVTYTPEFIAGGAFSLDGIHLNKRGYALIANQFVKAINAKFGGTVPEVDANSYPGIIFP